MTDRSLPAKVLYGALFALVLPALLVAWAAATASIVHAPVCRSLPAGIALALAGAGFMFSGVTALWVHGQGLPMNVYPPPRYVTQGIYRFFPHPIYIGFSMLCLGVAVAAGSPSGLWLVSPVVMLGCAALVLGYERHDLKSRFGCDPSDLGVLLPAGELTAPTTAERFSCYFVVLIPWLVLYEAVVALGAPPDALVAYLPFENHFAVLEWTEAAYLSTYVVVFLAPIVAKTRRDLRKFSVQGLLSMAVVFPLFLTIPLIAPPRPFTPHGALGTALAWERALDTPGAAFPSFHVIWALLAAEVFAGRMPPLRWVWRGWALLVAVSCVTTGMHAIVDVLGGFAAVALASRSGAVWELIRERAERIANSWKEWRFGPVRVINHGAYAGAGAFVALSIVGGLAGPGHEVAILVAAFTVLTSAALWAQFIEGSSYLLRPYGFYGGVLGLAIGAVLAPLFGTSPWLILAAFSVSAPWVQSLGRLRCLVQGCCHGRPAPEHVGIRYVHPQSRVCRIAEWTGVPLHPTPLYSILWNVLVAMAMARLWMLHASLHLIAGLYLILNGLGRFVEEAYRGEPQTPIIGGLRLYQWIAAGTVVIGALLTAIGDGAPAPSPQVHWTAGGIAAAFGLVTWFALGVDFPNSNRRFARLA